MHNTIFPELEVASRHNFDAASDSKRHTIKRVLRRENASTFSAAAFTFTQGLRSKPCRSEPVGKFSAQIALDPKNPQAGSVAFLIDTGSARFGSAELDAEVPKATWLNVPQFPQASFQSSAIKSSAPGRFEVAGKLSIKGVVRDLVVPVQVTQTGATSTASGAFVIKRLEFKVGEADWADTSMLANDIQVRFKLVLTGLAPL